jgi:rod shape-determining protein MreD
VTAGRGLIFILVGYAALVVTGALMTVVPWHLVPEVTLLVVLYLGLGGRGAPSGFVGVALVLGWLTDLFSGAPRGLHALSLGLLMIAARGVSNRLLVATRWQVLLVTWIAAIGHGALLILLASPLYEGELWRALRRVPLSTAVTALCAPLVFGLLTRLDRKLAPDPRALRMPGP